MYYDFFDVYIYMPTFIIMALLFLYLYLVHAFYLKFNKSIKISNVFKHIGFTNNFFKVPIVIYLM